MQQRRGSWRAGGAVPGLALLAVLASCCGASPQPPPGAVLTSRLIGSWDGRGNQTIGFGSDSGRFRVMWQARGDQAGTFRLAVHSAVSGRPIQLITDQRGPGSGSVNVDDDPRQYNLMIDSSALDWSVGVEEYVASRPPN